MLESVKIFARVPDEARRGIEAASLVLDPRDGAALFRQGDPADALYAIVAGDGFVRIAAASATSKVLMTRVRKELSRQPALRSATASR